MSKILNIRFHYTWIFVFLAITAIVTTQFSEDYHLPQRIIFGLAVSIVLLAAVTVRELLFSNVVFYKETPSSKLTLFVFGGIYRDVLDRTQPAHLPLYYLARFLSNLVIALILYGLYATFINADNQILAGIVQWLTYIYFLLFLLHFIPAYPLDGGQILRLALWKLKGDYYKATETASFIGWITGLFFIFAGVLVFIITQQWIYCLIIVLSGWIIEIAAGHTRSLVKIHMMLQGVKAQDIMTREYLEMPRDTKINQVVREQVLNRGFHYILVSDNTGLEGIVTLDRIRNLALKSWETSTIGDVMTSADQLIIAGPLETADILFEEMNLRKIEYIPVLEENKLKGVVTRTDLMNLVKIRTQFIV
jgi:CBS domain-containing protein/Zn-dependent protease